MADLRPVYVAGDGDVKGPASSSNNFLPLFANTTGKLLKSSETGVTTQGLAILDDNTPAEQRNTIGLDQVNNTSDVNKPVSTAQQTALNLKQDKLWYTPVQQGGGDGQGINSKIILGLNVAESRPSIIVDSQNYGGILFTSDLMNLPFSKQFESSQQQIANGSLVTVAHGLGSIPKLISGELVCLVAENAWKVGDIQHISLSPDNDDSASIVGFAVRKDAINVYARCCASGPYGVNIDTASTTPPPSAAKWRLVLRAFA